MFGLFGEKKKNKDTQISVGTGIIKDQFVQQMVAQATEDYAKPEYNPQTRKSHYDKGQAHKEAKQKAFSENDVVKDPYTGADLELTIADAKKKYGADWQKHLAEADHIDPLNQIFKRSKRKSFLKSKDIRDIGNSQDNFQIISRRTNQTGGKGGSTQKEWSQDDERMNEISKQTGRSAEEISDQIRKNGEAAERRNNARLARARVKNAVNTAHAAGKATAVGAGGTAAIFSGIYNIVSCINGEKTVTNALKDTGKDSSKAFIQGYANGAGLTVLNHTLTYSDSKFLVALGENNVAGKAITAVSVVGETVTKWGTGEISTERCLTELGEKGCNFCGSYYGGIIGDAIIPISVVGHAVGSFIGGVLTNEVCKWIEQRFQAASEEERQKQQEIYEAMMRYYAEQERRGEVQQLIQVNTKDAAMNSVLRIMGSEELQNLIHEADAYFHECIETKRRIAEYVLVTLQLREYRRQLQEYAERYFAGYEDCFESALELMDSSLIMGDYDGAIEGVNQITKTFGRNPVIESTEDFKDKIFGRGGFSF